MLYYVYVKKFLISVCNPITSKDELTATKGGMCLVLLSTTRHVWKPVICRSYFKNVYTLNRYTLNVYTLNSYTLNVNTLNRYTLNVYTLNSYTLNRYTLNVYTLNVYTLNVYTLNVYTLNRYTLNVYTLNVYTLNVNTLNRYTLNVYTLNRYTLNVYTLNRYTLSKYINVLTKTLLTVPVFVLTPENPDYSNHLGTFDIDSIYVVDLICLTKATVPNQRNIHKSTTNKQTTWTPTPTINGDISREFEPHQRLPLFPCTRNVTLIA